MMVEREPERGREPRPGSNRALVLEQLQSGVSSHSGLVKGSGLSSAQVSSAKHDLVSRGLISPVTPEQRREDWETSHSSRTRSLGRGGIWASIETYAQLEMSPREIREALSVEKNIQGSPFSPLQIRRALGKARRRGELPGLMSVGKQKGLEDRFVPKEKILRRIEPMIAIKQFMDAEGLEVSKMFNFISEAKGMLEEKQRELPLDRSVQFALGLFLYARMQKRDKSNDGPLALFNKALSLNPDVSLELRPYIDVIREATVNSSQSTTTSVKEGTLALPGEITLAEVFHS